MYRGTNDEQRHFNASPGQKASAFKEEFEIYLKFLILHSGFFYDTLHFFCWFILYLSVKV